MKKVLIFSNHPAYTFNLRKEVIDGFVREGYHITLVVPYGEEIKYFEKMGVKLVDITLVGRTTNPLTDLKLLRDNIRIIKNEKPDVILTYTTKQNIYGGLAARMTSVPYIPMMTGLGGAMENPGILQKITSTLYRAGTKKATTVFVQNTAILEKMKQFDMVNSPIRMTPGSGVSLERHAFADYPEKETPLQFVFIGRIMKDKGIFDLIEAIKRVKKTFPDVVFKIIGEGHLEEDTERVRAAEAEGLVEYLGPQADVRPYIRESHATILPSYYEGMANVLLESASAGRPVLASNVPGCRETFDEGISGIGFEAKNVDSLTEAIERFIQLPYEKKREMGLAGRKKMEREFSRELILQMYIEEIEKIGNKND
ncbi:glycosyltransferase family 4 protein [Atopococcus tabaci]|uniref:glycosyltransferase family 4 protein n=1 Tax=Atopococcus tabaci TaxID=269774 RepID=UPI000401A196|nr:glycosyltransferase family 4 protein [Atopococcus tabaci]